MHNNQNMGRSARGAFTVVEVTVVSVLMALLGVLLSSAWVGVGRGAVDLIGRSRLVQERDLAITALSRDLGGSLTEADARTGDKIRGRWLRWECPDNSVLPSNQDLKLSFTPGCDTDGNPLSNTVVRYLVMTDPDPSASTLVLVRRLNDNVSTQFTVARNVHSMTATIDAVENSVNVVLCFQHRKLTLTCDLTAMPPSTPANQPLPWSIDHY
jgi:hypothetical protein